MTELDIGRLKILDGDLRIIDACTTRDGSNLFCGKNIKPPSTQAMSARMIPSGTHRLSRRDIVSDRAKELSLFLYPAPMAWFYRSITMETLIFWMLSNRPKSS
jgi:hypothetical protein